MSQEVIKIKGGKKLNGKVQISGAKNSAVALIPASLMANDVVTLDGLPDISDVKTLMSLLGDLNIKTELMVIKSLLIQVMRLIYHYLIIKFNH